LVLTTEAAETLLARDVEAAAAQLAKVKAIAQESLDELRDLIFELRPPDLERDGLGEALRKHVELVRRQYGVEIELGVAKDVGVDPVRAGEIRRIAQEALANAVRHARASRLDVWLLEASGSLVLEVADNGSGFEPDAPELRSRRLGLTSMEE